MADDPVPPSSPPDAHATAADLPESPFFESQYNNFTGKSSSPPPLFSSDDSRETADIANYESPRIFKNKRKGTWWNNAEPSQSPGVKKAKMSRNFDSGVYMMSDATDTSEDLPVQHKSPFDAEEMSDAASQTESGAASTSFAAPVEQDVEEKFFCFYLNTQLDENAEQYNFSGLNVQDKHIRQIGKLASVIKNVPDPGDELPAEGQYRSMVPELFVDLKDNQLRHLTPSLFDVKNITSLILTNNNIGELPASISKMTRLKELNVSNNPLRWLPFELLQLCGSALKLDFDPEISERDCFLVSALTKLAGATAGKLDIIGDSGVPWLLPKTPQKHEVLGVDMVLRGRLALFRHAGGQPNNMMKHYLEELHKVYDRLPEREERLWHMRLMEVWPTGGRTFDEFSPQHPISAWGRDDPVYLARTLVSHFDDTGLLLMGSPVPPTCDEDDFAVVTETERGAHGVPATIFAPTHEPRHINSLATTALHTALRHKEPDVDLCELIGDPVIPLADALLARAKENDCAGFGAFRECNVCKREYVVAKAEWIEWWMVKSGKVFPFRKRVCSWACVPEEMRVRPERELGW